MKRYLSFFLYSLLVLGMVACGPENDPKDPKEEVDETPEYLDKTKASQMELYLGAVPVTADTTVVVTDAVESLSGAMQMGVEGSISGVKAFRVSIRRSAEGQKDELCAGVQCVPGNSETEQNIDFNLMGETSGLWYTHYTPKEKGDYTVEYRFQNYNRDITLKVIYRY